MAPTAQARKSHFFARARHHKGIATLLCIQHPGVGSKFGGAWVDANHQVKQFSKLPVPGLQGLHFTGVLLLNDAIKNYFFTDEFKEENILYDTLTKAMSQGEEVYATEIDAKWFETGNPADFLTASEECLDGLKQKPRAPWAEYLSQLICRCSTREHLVENTRSELKQKMQAQLEKTLAGRE